jgi:hypothetical protein
MTRIKGGPRISEYVENERNSHMNQSRIISGFELQNRHFL